MRNVEAFVTTEEDAIFVVQQGTVLQAAVQRPGVSDYVLATVIWHEMARLNGLDEQQAQRMEEQLWMQYVAHGQVDADAGLRYAALLRRRR